MKFRRKWNTEACCKSPDNAERGKVEASIYADLRVISFVPNIGFVPILCQMMKGFCRDREIFGKRDIEKPLANAIQVRVPG